MSRRTLPWLLVLALPGCMEGQKPNPLPRAGGSAAPPPLYARLGEEAGISKVVNDWVANIQADEDIPPEHKQRLQGGEGEGLKRKLVERMGAATGGPPKPGEPGLRESCRELLGLNDADFDALVRDLDKALEKNNVGEKEREELKALLAPARGEGAEQHR